MLMVARSEPGHRRTGLLYLDAASKGVPHHRCRGLSLPRSLPGMLGHYAAARHQQWLRLKPWLEISTRLVEGRSPEGRT